jgi:hypothetical protein
VLRRCEHRAGDEGDATGQVEAGKPACRFCRCNGYLQSFTFFVNAYKYPSNLQDLHVFLRNAMATRCKINCHPSRSM